MSKVKFKIKKGDKVAILTGKDKGSQGEVLRIMTDTSRAIVTVTVHAQSGDLTATWNEAEVFHFGSDGRVTDTWGVPEDQAVVDDFWAKAMAQAT